MAHLSRRGEHLVARLLLQKLRIFHQTLVIVAMLRCRMRSTDKDGRPEVHVRRVEQPDLANLLRMVTAHHGDITRVNLDTRARDVMGDTPSPWTLVAEVGGFLGG